MADSSESAAAALAGEASRFLTGCYRKVAIGVYHARVLELEFSRPPVSEIAVQAHFEGLMYAGVSAEEKLVRGLELLIGADNAHTFRIVRLLRRNEQTVELGRRLGRWAEFRVDDVALAEEARAIRNVATHEFYDRRGGEHGEWFYVARRHRVVHSGPVRGFAAAYAAHLEELRLIAQAAASFFGLEPDLAPDMVAPAR